MRHDRYAKTTVGYSGNNIVTQRDGSRCIDLLMPRPLKNRHLNVEIGSAALLIAASTSSKRRKARDPDRPPRQRRWIFLRQLWKALIEDLADSENDLPDVLRGDLISIGIWMLRETDAVEDGRSDVFRNLIEVSAMIRDGLK